MELTLSDYVGQHADCPDWTDECQENAARLCETVNNLMAEMTDAGVTFRVNPNTGTCVSGQMYGGFRPQNCSQGAPNSSHKEGLAVDLYDPLNEIDNWLMEHQDKLVEHGVYIESPDSTQHWSHWSIKPPGSGHHVFQP